MGADVNERGYGTGATTGATKRSLSRDPFTGRKLAGTTEVRTSAVGGKNKLKFAMSGDVELDKVLQEIAAEDGPRSINNAMRKALREAVKTIVFPAVVANLRRNNDTGLLMSQLRVKAGRRSRNRIRISVGFPDPLFQGDTYYAGFIEFGTKERTVKSTGQRVGRITADSFLRAALYPNTNKILALVRQRMAEFVATLNRSAA